MTTTTPVRNVVLVHGGFVDGSGWQSVYDLLTEDGYHVSIVQNPTLSLEDDAAVTARVLDLQDGPTVLVAIASELSSARQRQEVGVTLSSSAWGTVGTKRCRFESSGVKSGRTGDAW